MDLLIEQVEFADTIVLNKCDLVDPQELAQLEAILHYLNPNATLLRAEFGRVSGEQVLNTHRFDYLRMIQSPGWLQLLRGELAETGELGVGGFVYRRDGRFTRSAFGNGCKRARLVCCACAGYSGWRRARSRQGYGWKRAGPVGWNRRVDGRKMAANRGKKVFIGMDLDRAALTAALDACLSRKRRSLTSAWIGQRSDQFGDWEGQEREELFQKSWRHVSDLPIGLK